MTKMITMGVKLNEDIKARLQALGESRERTPHWLMKKAIIDFLDKEEEFERRNCEADEALSEYQNSGQYVSHETMDKWLETWGSDKEGPCPELKN